MWRRVYRTLERHFPEFDVDRWWGVADPFARMAGSVLVQHTAWANAERALHALAERGWLAPERLAALDEEAVAPVIRSAGFARAKSGTLIRLASWVAEKGGVERLRRAAEPTDLLRAELLAIKGIGAETADTILAYALGRPTFSGDAYARRLAARLTGREPSYEEIRTAAMAVLPDARDLMRLHGLLVEHGKHVCQKRTPRCGACLFADECAFRQVHSKT